MADVGPTTRNWIYERDNGCQFYEADERCASHRDLTLHHVLARRNGGGNQIDNLITLCRVHHDRIERDGALREALHIQWFRDGVVRQRVGRERPQAKKTWTRSERQAQAMKDADRRLRVGFVRASW